MSVRWQCPYCRGEGWSSDGSMPPHDRHGGGSCRPSGQRSEREIKREIKRDLDLDDLDEAIQDAICDDEGRLSPQTLMHHLAKRGMKIVAAEAHDYPRPIERLGPIIPGRLPRDHVHVWTLGWCRECGEDRP